MKPNGYTLVEMAVTLMIVSLLVIFLFPIYQHQQSVKQRISCQSNIKQLGLAFLQYTQDAGEKLPPVALNNVSSSVAPFARPFGWADALYPYIRSNQLWHCPVAQGARSADATQNGFTDYWLNTGLSGRAYQEIDSPSQTLLLGEGNDGRDRTDARYHRNALTQNWLDDPDSPASRHLGVADYLFADGHVKSYRPQILQTEYWWFTGQPPAKR